MWCEQISSLLQLRFQFFICEMGQPRSLFHGLLVRAVGKNVCKKSECSWTELLKSS